MVLLAPRPSTSYSTAIALVGESNRMVRTVAAMIFAAAVVALTLAYTVAAFASTPL